MGFPSLVLALVLIMALGGSLTNVTLAIAITLIPRMVRISRSSGSLRQIRSVRFVGPGPGVQ